MSWRDRWLEHVARTGPRLRQRLDQGRYLAQRGYVSNAEVASGRVHGDVREGRLRPFRAAFSAPPVDDDGWERVTEALSAELRYPAALLEGRLPGEILDVFAAVRAPLLPPPDQLDSSCTCGEAQPCKHAAALHEVFAARLDADPFLLFELRGRDRQTMIAALRRGGGDSETVIPGTVPLSDLTVGGVDEVAGSMDEVPLHPQPTDNPAWLLAHLGPPPAVDDPHLLEALTGRTAAFAWRLAAGEGTSAADEEVLLAELRAQRMATAAGIAEALGWDPERARDELDRLFGEGRVMRTGSGERIRYRAAPGS